VVHVIDEAQRATARVVNAAMTTTYWLIGRPIAEHEQLGSARVAHGESAVASAGDGLICFPLHHVRFMAARNVQVGGF